ncbi:hypothetical protein C0Q70_03098 [Pomacea canaliculata]|uniref:Uncharacterized protein n=1 Tax=Pomacea canaliculata TaxID=400727 RepID=A0A2T7PRT0_POMCA|nr:hypothetical protein C0Q70_03098 [Pomacea canaliculata]
MKDDRPNKSHPDSQISDDNLANSGKGLPMPASQMEQMGVLKLLYSLGFLIVLNSHKSPK